MDVMQNELETHGNLEEIQQDQQDEVPTQTTNSIFPPPPIAFKYFTRENVARYNVLKLAKEQDIQEGIFDWDNSDPSARLERQRMHLEKAEKKEREKLDKEDQQNSKVFTPSYLPSPSWDILLAMEPSNVDWIVENSHYTCFGESWPVEDNLATLQEMGMVQIYPSVSQDEIDRPAILTSLLRTLLKSYLSLIDTILAPPQEYFATQTDPETGTIINQQWVFTTQDKARQMHDVSINFMHLLNETRPLQAQEQLRDLMKDQLQKRKEETKLIRLQCESMRKEIRIIKNGIQFSQ